MSWSSRRGWVGMSDPDEYEEVLDDDGDDLARQFILANYYDGDESHPEVDEIVRELDGMHFIEFDEFGNEINYDDEDEIVDYAKEEEDEDDDEVFIQERPIIKPSIRRQEEVDYEIRVITRLYGKMHRWQSRALETWESNNYTGIIEAVTGSGKTFFGILAAARALNDGFGVVIVVPTRVLQEQWIAELHNFLSDDLFERANIVGGLGGEYGTDRSRGAKFPRPGRVVVAVAATFSNHLYLHPSPSVPILLIADEVHRYSGDQHSKIFNTNFERRLGLTGTFEPVLGRYSLYEDYFGPSPLFSYSFKEAINEDVVSGYDVVLIRVLLPDQARFEYERIWHKVRAVEDKLRFFTKISFNPEKVHREKSELKEKEEHLGLINEWENLNDDLDFLLSNTATKERAMSLLAPFIQRRGQTVVFTDYIPLAEHVQLILTKQGVHSKLLDSRVKQEERAQILRYFDEGRIQSLISPRVLDEGVNLPSLSFGVFAGVRRRRLQMLQRLGRVLRKSPDKSWPIVCIPVSINTLEDPLLSGNEDLAYSPLKIILENAANKQIVNAVDVEGLNKIFEAF